MRKSIDGFRNLYTLEVSTIPLLTGYTSQVVILSLTAILQKDDKELQGVLRI